MKKREKSEKSELRARYVGDGEFYQGIAARDLTAADWEGLTEAQRALVAGGDLYEVAVARSGDRPQQGAAGKRAAVKKVR